MRRSSLHLALSVCDGHVCTDSGLCLSSALVCDKKKDCSDGSDESNCRKIIRATPFSTGRLACDTSTEFECSPGECVDRSLLCDGVPHCQLGEDETLVCACGQGQFWCAAGECVDEERVCDGVWDCKAGQDESKDVCTSRSIRANKGTYVSLIFHLACDPPKFRCSSDDSKCLDEALVCDGAKDCPGGEDEDQVKCPNRE